MTQALIVLAVSFVLTLVIGKILIPELRKLKAGQEIREDGPTWHKSKAGTPTMGGIMFILGGGVTVFAWAGTLCCGAALSICTYISSP
ncbi:MAG: hypothetical protein V8R40_10930 [Dysosmobacter sp.]